MNRLARALLSLDRALAERRVPWALIGGLAVSARTEPRFTRDIDVVVAAADDAAAEVLVRELGGVGYRLFATLSQDAVGRLATVRLLAPGESSAGVVVDLLFASSGIEPEIVAGATSLEIFEGLSLPVARVGHLIALKVLARDDRRRPQDLMDLRSLLAVASPEDLAEARQSLDRITKRGFHRDRALVEDLGRLLLDA